MEDTQSPYTFERGYPAADTADCVHDASDLRRAIEAYKFFYPTVATESLGQELLGAGAQINERSLLFLITPKQVIPTADSDTPYAIGVFDLSVTGPLVVEIPAGPFIGICDDWHMRWVHEMGLPGPDRGEGGKHLVLPPDFKGEIPQGYFVGRSQTANVILGLRAIPVGGDLELAFKAFDGFHIYPLKDAGKPPVHQFIDMRASAGKQLDFPLLIWEHTLKYWKQLKNVIDAETVVDEFKPMYGLLASLGIVKGRPFTPDARMKKILTEAGRTALEELRTVSYASRIPERICWQDRKWEWLMIRPATPEYGAFGAPSFLDLEARDCFSFQAWGTSPGMGQRAVGAGSMSLGAYRDETGAYLDGGETYKLAVPQPVPAGFFWSVTIYDVDTRAQIATDQNQGALGSLFGKFQANSDGSIELYFGPMAPVGKEGQWIKTIPGKGWFTYFRIFGPQAPAFDGTWKLPDIELVK